MSQKLSNSLSQVDQTPVVLAGEYSNEVRITSVELTETINKFRQEEGNTTELQHKTLLDSIRTEIQVLENAGIAQQNFLPGTYKDKNKQERPCFLLNRNGVLQMLNKESAVVRFKTTQYIDKLEERVTTKQKPMCIEDAIIESMKLQKEIREQLNQVNHHALEAKATAEKANEQINTVKEAMLLDHDSWRKECNNIINKIAKEQRGGSAEAYKEVRNEVYSLVEQRAGANLKQRVTNKQDRMRREGLSKSKVDKISQIDVIAEEKRLKEIYIAVVKEMAIKYGVA